MPTLKEIKLALGNMDKSSNEPSREVININENTNPFSEKLFAPVEDLQQEKKEKEIDKNREQGRVEQHTY